MKFLTILLSVAGVGLIAGALAVGCGPQKAYCPQSSTGQCLDQDTGVAPPPPEAGAGESVVIGGD